MGNAAGVLFNGHPSEETMLRLNFLLLAMALGPMEFTTAIDTTQ